MRPGLLISLWLGIAMALMIVGGAIDSLALIIAGGVVVVAFFLYGWADESRGR